MVGRVAPVSQAVKQTKILHLVLRSGKPLNSVIDFSEKSIVAGAVTCFECEIVESRKLGGLQKRKYLSDAAQTFLLNTKGYAATDLSPKDVVHPSLHAISK